jgi:hypothetical protein
VGLHPNKGGARLNSWHFIYYFTQATPNEALPYLSLLPSSLQFYYYLFHPLIVPCNMPLTKSEIPICIQIISSKLIYRSYRLNVSITLDFIVKYGAHSIYIGGANS